MLTLIDNITIVLCVVGIFAISVFMSKKNTDMEAYYHANKALPWSLAVGTIAASWYGGNGTIGTVGYVTTMGLSAFFIWSIGAHLVRFPLALWVAPRISVKVNSTMTELLDRFYGRIASFIGAIILLATCLSISEIGACGYVGVAAWNMNKFLAAAIVIAISIGLSCVGGLLGVAITDMIFFFLMIVSVAFVFPSAFYGVGGFAALDEIFSTVDPSMMTPFGGIPLGRAIVLILICINVYKDPAFYQRFTASNGPKTGKRAMLTCFSIWLSMDVCLMFTAIVIRAMDPALTSPRLLTCSSFSAVCLPLAAACSSSRCSAPSSPRWIPTIWSAARSCPTISSASCAKSPLPTSSPSSFPVLPAWCSV